MYPNLGHAGRRSRVAAGLTATAAAALGFLSACGQSPHSPTAGAITAGPGQHQVAGMPGASRMPGMNMSPGSPKPGAADAPVAKEAVAIRNFAFSPETLKVTAGTTVTWTNQDTDAHTVTSAGTGGPLHSPALATHAAYSYRFTTPGTYTYLCTIHPFMTAKVVVTR